MSGLRMLIVQAIESRNIWLDDDESEFREELQIDSIKRDILTNQLNIVVIGMPGSGKTSILRRYAYEFGKTFFDTDKITEDLMGDSIENVLNDESKGEEYFRKWEHEAVKSASKNIGAVIATGGGAILNPVNRDWLRSNSLVIYMRRPLDKLSVKGRPVSESVGIENLYKNRDYIYKKTADFTINNDTTFGEKKAETGEGDSYYYEMKKFIYQLNKRVKRYVIDIACNKWT